MKKICLIFLAALLMSACIIYPTRPKSNWVSLPPAGTVKADALIAYIAENTDIDDRIVNGLNSQGFTNVKKTSPGTTLPNDYQYSLTVFTKQNTHVASSYLNADPENTLNKTTSLYISYLTFTLDDQNNEPVAIIAISCTFDEGDTSCLDRAISEFSKRLLAEKKLK